jgi:hypothetical protein
MLFVLIVLGQTVWRRVRYVSQKRRLMGLQRGVVTREIVIK